MIWLPNVQQAFVDDFADLAKELGVYQFSHRLKGPKKIQQKVWYVRQLAHLMGNPLARLDVANVTMLGDAAMSLCFRIRHLR